MNKNVRILLSIGVIYFTCNLAIADSLDRALNMGTLYGGIGTATGVVNTYSNVATGASLRRNIETQTALMQIQAANMGIDIRSGSDIMRERTKLYQQCRFYVIDAKHKAKFENDKEMLALIKKYYNPWTQQSAIYAAQKIQELRETRNPDLKNKTVQNLKMPTATQQTNIKTIADSKITQTNNPYLQPINPAAEKFGVAIAEKMANSTNNALAKQKLKEIKNVAKIENDRETLEIIKKYKKAGAVVTLQKLEEKKGNKK